MYRIFFYEDDVYRCCSKILPFREIQKFNLFPISIKIPSKPSIIELVFRLPMICFQIRKLLLHLCNN